jgi:hypothetical protein
MFIPDPASESRFFPSQIPDPGVKKKPNPGSATLLKRPKFIVSDLGNIKLWTRRMTKLIKPVKIVTNKTENAL